MFILTLFCLLKDLQCVNWRSSAQLGEAILNCLMTKQVQKQGTLHCQQKSVLVFLSCTHILFYKQTLLAVTGSKMSHSHHWQCLQPLFFCLFRTLGLGYICYPLSLGKFLSPRPNVLRLQDSTPIYDRSTL